MNSDEHKFAAQVTKLGFLVRMIACTTFIAPASAALAQSTSSDIWPESHIDCEKSRWEITVEDPEGRPVTVELARSKIILCGWVMDGWEMFTFNRKGCILKRKDRFWMRNVDAAKIRQCFR